MQLLHASRSVLPLRRMGFGYSCTDGSHGCDDPKHAVIEPEYQSEQLYAGKRDRIQ